MIAEIIPGALTAVYEMVVWNLCSWGIVVGHIMWYIDE
jgi:hypothetical protein